MRTRLVTTATLALAAAGLATSTLAPAANADPGGSPNGRSSYTYALIGDVPYGSAQIAAFPSWIQQINADRDVRMTIHLGDIKNGSTVCSDDYFKLIKSDFDTFAKPFVYTPGDNEWTDCHRTNNGAYNPLERLAKVRETFFATPGRTLGQHSMKVTSQASAGVPENVEWRESGVTFAAVNVVGSNNDLQPWTGIGQTSPTPAQLADLKQRTDAAISLVHKAFADAAKRGDRAVVINQQADMFDPTYTPSWNDISAFKPYLQAIIDESSRFGGQVYLFNGDSHVYNSDKPLASGSPWLTTYGVTGSADNLQRITCDGSSNNKDWLKVTINKPGSANVLSWTRVPYTTQP